MFVAERCCQLATISRKRQMRFIYLLFIANIFGFTIVLCMRGLLESGNDAIIFKPNDRDKSYDIGPVRLPDESRVHLLRHFLLRND